MSICPRELQSILHSCQHWSIRNRMQINTEKTKIMVFFETPALLRARGGQHQPSPTMLPFHVYSPFLSLSLSRVLHVYGDHTGLLVDTGIPPLQLTRYVHLAQLHFRLTITRPDTLPALLFKKLNLSLPLPNLHTSTLDYHIRYATQVFKVDLQTDPLSDMSSQLTKNRERAVET